MCRHFFQRPRDIRGQHVFCRLANRVQAGSDTAARGRNFFVGSAFDSLLEIYQPRADEDGVRVRIDETGEHDLASAIDLDDFAAMFFEPRIAQCFLSCADRNDLATEAQESAVFDDAEFLEVRGTAWARTARG